MLRRHKLTDGAVVLCANHAAVAGRRKLALAELKAECLPAEQDRRKVLDRRRSDRRQPADRRQSWDAAWELDQDQRQRDRRVG